MKRSDIPDAEILEAIRRRKAGETDLTPERLLADRYPPKLILSKMEHMVDRGLLEYGVSLRTAWPVSGS